MNKDKINFIVIDDSKLDCFIAEKIIQTTGKSDIVKTFLQASEALNYIKESDVPTAPTIMFVDIQMPVMNGFEFVEAFDNTLPDEVKSKFTIYMLSSSINENDIAKVKSMAIVKQFINKPLTVDAVNQVFDTVVV